MVIANPLPDCPEGGTPFETSWPVRLGDTDGDERLRLDAVARYLQDIGYEHLEASVEGDLHRGWVVRRNVIDVLKPIEFGERVVLRRWCSALSNRWCNMRIQISGSAGGLIETEAFLIHFGEESGVPTRMSDAFMAPMLATTTEHRLRWKAALSPVLPQGDGVEVMDYGLRVIDIDRLGHVNNAVHFAGIEEMLTNHVDVMQIPYRAVLEYSKPLMAGDAVRLHGQRDGTSLDVWFEVGGEVRAVAKVSAL
jgi:acyl-ACP thioesterase